jgi:hypothetical protein
MSSPTQRSLELLRNEGYTAQVVEKWVQYPPPGHRVDLFGFVDIIAVHPFEGTLAVQACSGAGGAMAERRRKLTEDPIVAPRVAICKMAGWKIELMGWVKRKVVRGGVAVRYEVRRERI